MNETCLRRPTQRAVDNWDSPRFLAGFNASAGFRFRACSASRPVATNASRWAVVVHNWDS